jgi:hypothetical protein
MKVNRDFHHMFFLDPFLKSVALQEIPPFSPPNFGRIAARRQGN